MSAPTVAIVVSTFNRPGRLERLLDALAVQTLDSHRFEVVVVDNGSGRATRAVLERCASSGTLPVRVVRSPVTLGPAAGRNRGWRAARAPLVAFTDDDCAPDPGWLAAGLAAWDGSETVFLQGRTVPETVPGLAPEGLLVRTQKIERLGPQFQTCNIFYPRGLLERLDGFDERFGLRPAGEDTDLAWRALAGGARAVHVPEAVVEHALERIGALGQLRVAARWGDGARVYRDHPGARAMLFRGWFWNEWHYLLVRSLLGLAAPGWLRRLILTRHLVALRARARRGGAGVWAIPYLVVHDAVECWSVARGAARERTWLV